MASQPQHGFLWNGHPVRGVIFDMDGVIADTRQAHIDAWLEFARRVGVTLDIDDFIRKTFGRSNMQNFCYLFPDRVEDRAWFSELSTLKEDLFIDRFLADGIGPLDGLLPFLARLAGAGVSLSVGSSAPRKNIETVLGKFGVRDRFPYIASMEDVVYSKPDPQIFLLCCKAMGLDPRDCVVFEDSIHGLEAARAAGCRAVGITTMHTVGEIAPLCAATVPDFVDFETRVGWSRPDGR